jgi:uncharacterized membrane protein
MVSHRRIDVAFRISTVFLLSASILPTISAFFHTGWSNMSVCLMALDILMASRLCVITTFLLVHRNLERRIFEQWTLSFGLHSVALGALGERMWWKSFAWIRKV